MASKIVSLDQQLKRVKVKSFELKSPIVFEYFNSLPADERDERFLDAIQIGVLALKEDRLSAFFTRVTDELGVRLESLKMIFEMRREVMKKATIKGTIFEEIIIDALNSYIKEKGFKDEVVPTGETTGAIKEDKTGDIVVLIDGDENKRLTIECKFDKSVSLEHSNVFTKNKIDSALSQLIEAQANRDAPTAIIVFDISNINSTVLKFTDSVRYVPEFGFVVVVNHEANDFRNLFIAYILARDIVLNIKEFEYEKDLLEIMVNRLVKDIEEFLKIRDLVEKNIENNKEILKQIERGILLFDFHREYFKKFLSSGRLTKKELLEFYTAEDIRTKYLEIQKELEERYKE